MTTLGCKLGPYSRERMEATIRTRYGGTTRRDRVLAKIEQGLPFDCWPWQGAIGKLGYGTYGTLFAHRLSYEYLVGPIPAGTELDHTCRNKTCVNPAHLEPVTHRENILRGGAGILRRRQATCRRGHPWTPENTHRTTNGYRQCRACRRVRYYRRRGDVTGLTP